MSAAMREELRHGDPRLLTNRERLVRINELLEAENRYCEKLAEQSAEIARLREALERAWRVLDVYGDDAADDIFAALARSITPFDDEQPCEVCGNEERTSFGTLTCECPAPLGPDELREMRDERRRMECEFPMRDEP